MRKSALFYAKNCGHFEIYGVSAQTRELTQCGDFAERGEAIQFFAILCGRSLQTCPLDYLLMQHRYTKYGKHIELRLLLIHCCTELYKLTLGLKRFETLKKCAYYVSHSI